MNFWVPPSIDFRNFPVGGVGKFIEVFEWKDGLRFDVPFPCQHHPVVFLAQKMGNATDVFVSPGMVGVSSVPDWVNPGIQGMPGRGAHGSGLITP